MSSYDESANLPDFALRHALDRIESTYGVIASLKQKKKSLLKHGTNDDVGTAFETVWYRGGDETYASTNAIDTISSSDTGDTQTVVVEGHTVDGSGDFSFVVQSATLNGRNKVVLGTPLARMSRLYNDDSTAFAGDIYGYQDGAITNGVPDTAADVHVKVLQSDGDPNQSQKAATTISKDDYWILTQFYGSVHKKTSTTADFVIEVREKGKVFRTRFKVTSSASSDTPVLPIDPPIIVPSNADIRIRARANTTGADVSAWVNGYLAIKDRDA